MSDLQKRFSQFIPAGKKYTTGKMKEKVKRMTKTGVTRGLGDNLSGLDEVIEKRNPRFGKAYGADRQRSDYQQILKSDPNLTTKDKKQIKAFLKHLGTPAEVKKTETSKPKPPRRPPSNVRKAPDFSRKTKMNSPFSPSGNSPFGSSGGAGGSIFSQPGNPVSKPSTGGGFKFPKLFK